jgi:hypothetical protein
VRRLLVAGGVAVLLGIGVAGCGAKSPTQPNPTTGGNGGQTPPTNKPPVIETIAAQGSRAKEPPAFADVGETIRITATVHDAETPTDRLDYDWTASAGTITGSGATVTWTAPKSVKSPIAVTIGLTVVENYGSGSSAGQNKVSETATISLHDSESEVGGMARRFLLDFSDSSIRNVPYVMRNFSVARCPHPKDVDDETLDVTNNRTNFTILDYEIGDPEVTVKFGGQCPFRSRLGDACAVVPSFWKSIDLRDNPKRAEDGDDIISAVYAPSDDRWWLCASDFDGHAAFGAARYGFIR